MAIVVNRHELTGRVVLRKGPVPIGVKNMKKSAIYVAAKYLFKGQEIEQTVKAICFSFADNVSKVTNVYPGDEVRFSFTLSGRINEEKPDKNGWPGCWPEVLIDSPVEILNNSQRQLYNRDDQEAPVPQDPKFKYQDGENVEEKDDPANDLPFVWLIPLLLAFSSSLTL